MTAAAVGGARTSRSLRRQLLCWLVPLLLLISLASGVASYSSFAPIVRLFMADQMTALARSHEANRLADITPLPRLVREHVDDRGNFIVQLWHPDGHLITSGLPEVDVPLQARPGHALVPDPVHVGTAWRVYTSPASARDDQPRVQVLQSEQFLVEQIAERAAAAALPVACLVPVLLGVMWFVVARVSRDLRAVADDVARRDHRQLDHLPTTRVPDEIAPLVGAFNTLLARLQQAFTAQRRFVQDAAHELRTPMTAVALQVENLRALMPDGRASEQLAQLEAGMRRAHHLVEQLLRLSRQDAPPSTAPREQVDLTALLRACVGQCMALADRRRIDVGFDGKVQPQVRGAISDLRSIFDNLLDNALRYTPEGGEVEVRVSAAADGPVVDVVDNGPGVAPELRERVFDRFYRVPGSAAGGSGLGLAITRAAAERQGFRVELLPRDDGLQGLMARVHLTG